MIAAAATRWNPASVSRHCSGSSRAAIAVEPTRSQNSTVRCRRSPLRSALCTDPVSETGVPIDESQGAPHSPQNFAAGAFSALHRGQRMRSPTPHSEQYFFPAGFSDPHFEQRIEVPRQQATRRFSITQCRYPTTGLSGREKLATDSTEYKLYAPWSTPKGKRTTMLVPPDYVSTPLRTAKVEPKWPNIL